MFSHSLTMNLCLLCICTLMVGFSFAENVKRFGELFGKRSNTDEDGENLMLVQSQPISSFDQNDLVSADKRMSELFGKRNLQQQQEIQGKRFNELFGKRERSPKLVSYFIPFPRIRKLRKQPETNKRSELFGK